ncbi:hypothetical protein SPF06_20105 [Sinomonas sp. JGH33]|uniref:DUF998 domain-containing protein n=1 Tax=Sinomonas terricola TaxID=3110330 RepID=A0ABU5TC20_9MICC|nr:hypothetical protein [Sinomonas sp. JGH33]MEA5457034.1 hypothetical protein [Sinomonas sp. JGH33]
MTEARSQRTNMRVAALAGLGGLAAVAAAALGAAASYMHSLAPEGTEGYRDTTPQVAALAFSSVVLACVGLLGLAVLSRARGRSSWLALTASLLVAAGLTSLTSFSVSGASEEGWAWWSFGATGFVAMMLGLVLGGVHVIITRVVPRWAGVLAVVASAALFFFNTETAAVLFAAPAALAWGIVGGFALGEALGDLGIVHRHAPAVGA